MYDTKGGERVAWGPAELDTANQWYHIAGTMSSGNNKYVYVDGSPGALDFFYANPVSLDLTTLGAFERISGPQWPLSGGLAEVGFWNIDLDTSEISALAKGISPLLIRPQNLVAYWPLIREGAAGVYRDIIGGLDTVESGGSATAPHPRIIRPVSPLFVPAAVPVGYYNVYRGQDGNMDYSDPVAVMVLGEADVTIIDQDLPPLTRWHFVRRQVSACDLESPDSDICRVEIDSAGDMILATPNPPTGLVAEVLAGAIIRLRWRYSQLGEEVTPTAFRIYVDSGSGVDFSTPDATIDYVLGGSEREWTSGSLVDGTMYKFCVRSYHNDPGTESSNDNFVSATADSTGPAAITGISGRVEDA